MFLLRALPLLACLALGIGCVDTDMPANLSALTPALADTSDFFPNDPLSRTFAYSRISPDGSTVVGTISMEIVHITRPSRESPSMRMHAVVNFRADGMIFSPEQAHAIQPASDWPADRKQYPLHLAGISADYVFVSSLAQSSVRDPSDLALFWSSGILGFLGMVEKPSDFDTLAVGSPTADDGACLSVRGTFRNDKTAIGTYLFTFRRSHSLTSITGTLVDGTRIAMVEKLPEQQRVIHVPAGPLASAIPGPGMPR